MIVSCIMERMRILFLLWCVLWGQLACGGEQREARNGLPPNVLLIYTDDQGTLDAHCYGARDLATPALDRLAAQGVRFTRMYAPSAICSASRAGLLTGRYPARAGVPANCSSQPGVPGMPSGEITIAELLKEAGYATAHVGKWHLGYSSDTMPLAQGFDYSFGHMGGCIDNYSHYFYWAGPNRHDLWRNGEEVWYEGQFFLDLMVRECIKFIRDNRHRPFFLYWAINMPHYPLQPVARWRSYYSMLPMPRSLYAAFLSTMDEGIAQVLDELDRCGLSRNTLVIVQSDHGHSTEERAFGGGGYAGPYRGAKGCLFEGGIRVPSIAALPGVIPAGEVRDQAVFGCDWLPTIAELCGARTPPDLDGQSLVGVLRSAAAPSPHEYLYWRLGRGPRAQWAVMEGDWKLLGNPRDTSNAGPLGPDDNPFLVNLSMDPGERTNLAQRYPEIVRRLRKRHEEIEKTIAASLSGRTGGAGAQER